MTRPLLLLPPSRGKAPGGDGPPYRQSLRGRDPLLAARRRVLAAAVEASERVDEHTVGRICGVRGHERADARARLGGLPTALTLPAHQRYTGVVHGNAGLAGVDSTHIGVDIRIVSGLLGLAALDDAVPAYRLEFGVSLPEVGGLATFWRDRLTEVLLTAGEGVRVWDLLPREHRRIWHRDVRDELSVSCVDFLGPDGRPANAARTKVAKGRFAAWIMGVPDADPAEAARHAELGPGWRLELSGAGLTAAYRAR